MDVPHLSNIGAHLALGIASRVNRFGILEGKFPKVQLELLEGVALVEKLNELQPGRGKQGSVK